MGIVDLTGEDLEEPLVADIRINGVPIIDNKSTHWEPQDLIRTIEEKLGEGFEIFDVEMLGVSGSSIVIDELIDCIGTLIQTRDQLKVFIFDIATNSNLTGLSPSVFESLA